MARRTAKQKKQQARIALALAGVVLVAILLALLTAFPGLESAVYDFLGIRQRTVVPGLNSDSPTAVHVIDVGQGDAVLLQQDGAFALIDAGPPEGQEALLSYLEQAGAGHIEYLFMTHPHADHIGGMQAVLERFSVGVVVFPDLTKAPSPSSKVFENLLASMVQYGIEAQTAAEGAVYPLGSGSITVVHNGMVSDNLNLLSLGLLFEAEGMRFLNTGDAEKPNEKEMLEGEISLRADVFVAGHHGSSTSNTADFVGSVRPVIVVISCAAGNSYGHPHLDPLAVFEEVGATVLRTDQHGSVVVQPDGEGGFVYNTAYGMEPVEQAA